VVGESPASVGRVSGDHAAVGGRVWGDFRPVADLFQEQLHYRSVDLFCPKPVHPNAFGHLLIAHAWLTAMGW